jgi:hypothetical protein
MITIEFAPALCRSGLRREKSVRGNFRLPRTQILGTFLNFG